MPLSRLKYLASTRFFFSPCEIMLHKYDCRTGNAYFVGMIFVRSKHDKKLILMMTSLADSRYGPFLCHLMPTFNG